MCHWQKHIEKHYNASAGRPIVIYISDLCPEFKMAFLYSSDRVIAQLGQASWVYHVKLPFTEYAKFAGLAGHVQRILEMSGEEL